LFEDGIKGHGDIYPLSISRQQWSYDLMVALAT
jgi:hypothetical protein